MDTETTSRPNPAPFHASGPGLIVPQACLIESPIRPKNEVIVVNRRVFVDIFFFFLPKDLFRLHSIIEDKKKNHMFMWFYDR
jgi:hypothetical protein